MKRKLVEQYSGIKFTEEQFTQLEEIGKATSFPDAFDRATEFLDAMKDNKKNFAKALQFVSDQVGIEPEKLQEIAENPHTKGAAILVNQAFISMDMVIRSESKKGSKESNVQSFRNKIGSQAKIGKVFASIVSTLQESDIAFETIKNALDAPKGMIPRETLSAYQDLQTAIIKDVQDAIKDSGLVGIKSQGVFSKTHYLSIRSDAEALIRAKEALQDKLQDAGHLQEACKDYNNNPVDIPIKSEKKSYVQALSNKQVEGISAGHGPGG